jgi:hypothetical protein
MAKGFLSQKSQLELGLFAHHFLASERVEGDLGFGCCDFFEVADSYPTPEPY